MHGYELISFILKHKPKLLHSRVVDILFGIVGVSDECVSGHIANLEAFKHFFMDYSLWRYSSIHCKKRIFQGLINAITLNPLKQVNITALRQLRIIPYLMSLLSDRFELSVRYHLNPFIMLFIASMLKADVLATMQQTGQQSGGAPTPNNISPTSASSSSALSVDADLKPLADFILHVPPPHLQATTAAPTLNPNFGAEDAGILPPKPEVDPNYRPELLSDCYIKNCILETILTTLLRINEQQVLAARNKTPLDDAIRSKVQAFLQHFDLAWIIGVVRNAVSQSSQESTPSHSIQKNDATDADLHGAPPVYSHAQTVLWTLQILSVLIQCSSSLHHKFTSTHAAHTLSSLLIQRTEILNQVDIYGVLLAMMMGKNVRISAPGANSSVSPVHAKGVGRAGKRRGAGRKAVPADGENSGVRAAIGSFSQAFTQDDDDPIDDESAQDEYGDEVSDLLSPPLHDGAQVSSNLPTTSSGIPISETPSQWDYLLYRSAPGGPVVVDAQLYVPECMSIVCKMMQHILSTQANKTSPSPHSVHIPSASDPTPAPSSSSSDSLSRGEQLCISVFSFLQNLFNVCAEFRALLACSHPVFWRDVADTLFVRIHAQCAALLKQSNRLKSSADTLTDLPSARKNPAGGAMTARTRASSVTQDKTAMSVEDVHMNSHLAFVDEDDDFHVAARSVLGGGMVGIGSMMDEEDGEGGFGSGGAGVLASPHLYQAAYSAINRSNSSADESAPRGLALNFDSDDDPAGGADPDDDDISLHFAPLTESAGGNAGNMFGTAGPTDSPPSDRHRARSGSTDNNPLLSPTNSNLLHQAQAVLSTVSPASDNVQQVLIRFICHVIFFALSHDRPNFRQIQHVQQVSAMAYDAQRSGGSAGVSVSTMASNATGGSVTSSQSSGNDISDISLLEDALDLLPPDCQPWSRQSYQSRILRSIAQRVLDRPTQWAEAMVNNNKLFVNFTKLVELCSSRISLGWFDQGAFVTMEVLIALLECQVLKGASITGSIFSSVSRVKAKVVSFLISSLNKSLLLLYSDASSRHSAAE